MSSKIDEAIKKKLGQINLLDTLPRMTKMTTPVFKNV